MGVNGSEHKHYGDRNGAAEKSTHIHHQGRREPKHRKKWDRHSDSEFISPSPYTRTIFAHVRLNFNPKMGASFTTKFDTDLSDYTASEPTRPSALLSSPWFLQILKHNWFCNILPLCALNTDKPVHIRNHKNNYNMHEIL
jgi:hypothetical protein